MTKDKYNVLVVDDEFLARKLLQDYVSKIDSLNLVGCCANAMEAVQVLHEHQVDILLCDIQMPDLTGMDMIKSLDNKPAVIFTTAYSEYAVDAFEIGVADYLLKPFNFPRFFQAINKVIGRAEPPMLIHKDNTEVKDDNDFFVVKADYKLYKIKYSELLYVEGQHEYVTFHTPGRRITALYALKDLESQLPRDRFIRVHKSYIVSFDNIQDVDKNDVTVAGNKIPVGASYRDDLLLRLQKKW